MANRYGDPKVREWMREHEDEVEKVQARYDELKALSLQSLVEAAPKGTVEKCRGVLISSIIAAESEKRQSE